MQISRQCLCICAWLFVPCFLSLLCTATFADNVDLSQEIVYKYKLIDELKREIAQIDAENARCEKMKNGWVAATVVGGVGVVATGTAAIIQASKLKDKPKIEDKKVLESKTGSGDGDK